MNNVSQRYHINNIEKKDETNIRFISWLLAIYFFVAPLDFLPMYSGVSIPSSFIFIPLLGSFLYIKYLRIKVDRFLIIPVLYFVVVMGTIFFSYDVNLTVKRTMSIGINIAVILVFSMLDYYKEELQLFVKAIVISGWLTLVLMLFYGDSSVPGGRLVVIVNGMYQDPNELCGFLLFPIAYYLNDFIQNGKKLSFIKMGIFIFFALLTGSRGGLLAISGVIFFYILTSIFGKGLRPKILFKQLGLLFLLILFFVFSLNFLSDSVVERFNPTYTQEDGGSSRLGIWEDTLYNYKYSPTLNKILGWGAGTIYYFNYKGAVAHNVWVESLVEIGIIGMVILFIFYFTFFKKAITMKEYVVASTFGGYMVMTLTLSLYSYRPLWNIILLILLFKNHQKRNLKRIE